VPDPPNNGRPPSEQERAPVTVTNDPRRRRAAGSGFDRRSGRREMKEYPLTEGELNELATLGIGATIAFAIMSALLGFAVDVTKDFAFEDVPAAAKSFWSGLRLAALLFAAASGALGIGLLWRGRNRLRQIKRSTRHD
jgi:hypothetical protein